MLDFLTAMVIVVGAVTVYFTAASVLVDVQSRQGDAPAHAGLRATERIADDVLYNGTGDGTLTPDCTQAFFTGGGAPDCGFRDRGRGQDRLRAILGLDDGYAVNVTVENATGVVRLSPDRSVKPFRHAVGEAVPLDGEVTTYYRTVTYGGDDDGDDRVDYYTLYVRLWEVA